MGWNLGWTGAAAGAGLVALMIASAGLDAQAAAPKAKPQPRAAPALACPIIPAFADGKVIAADRMPGSAGLLVERVNRALADRRDLGSKADVRLKPKGTTVTVTSWGTLVPGRTVLIATRKRSGVWSMLEVHDNPPSTRHTATPEMTVKRGRMSKPDSRALDALLADPCLYGEPAYIGNVYPLTDGEEGACYDGGDTLIEIALPGRRRTAFQACILYGLNGRLVDALGKPLEPAPLRLGR